MMLPRSQSGTHQLEDGCPARLIRTRYVRMNRVKARLADLDAKMALQAADEDRLAHVHSVMTRFAELSSHLPPQTEKDRLGDEA